LLPAQCTAATVVVIDDHPVEIQLLGEHVAKG
jgi:hypothetical protein